MEAQMLNASVVHGAFDYAELAHLGVNPDNLIDLSVNSNPYGPSPLVRPALAQVPIERYPDRECRALRAQLQVHELGTVPLSQDALICGNGTSELIHVVARALLRPGDKAALIEPTFGEYRAASLLAGADVIAYHTQVDDCFALDAVALCAWLEREQPAVLWVCNPNNPTGQWLDQQMIELLAATCQRYGTVLVVDEAYRHFLVPRETYSASELVARTTSVPVVVLRSLTKEYALAGLRLGYAVAAPAVVARLRSFLPAWNVNAFAQAAGVAALSDQMYLRKTLVMLAQERQAFFQALTISGVRLIPSRTHYCLLEVGNVTRVRLALLQKHFLIRDCTSFGLPHYIRVSTQRREYWRPFVQALQDVLAMDL
jgi:Histidinol-phosphate/aromatic aminotransferase and cobyric acid decarboxylase